MQKATSKQKAWAAVALFGVAAAIASLWAHSSAYFWPDLFFYAVLTFNSYFSIKLHARIQPKNAAQTSIDLLLTVTYLLLAFSIGHPIFFPFCTLIVFVLAPVKYALMLEKVPHPTHLKRKILIDLAGTALCTLALGIAIAGSPLFAAWFLACVNVVANIYYLAIRPMYLLSEI